MAEAAEELAALIKQAEKLKERQAKAAGAKEEILSRLKKMFDCSTLEDAKELLASKKKRLKKLKIRFEKEIAVLKEALEEHEDE